MPTCQSCQQEIAEGATCTDCLADFRKGLAFKPASRPKPRTKTENRSAEAERLAELARLRDGQGTADELADYDAARRMRLSGE